MTTRPSPDHAAVPIRDVYRPEGMRSTLMCSQCATTPPLYVVSVLQDTIMLECRRCEATFPRPAALVSVHTNE